MAREKYSAGFHLFAISRFLGWTKATNKGVYFSALAGRYRLTMVLLLAAALTISVCCPGQTGKKEVPEKQSIATIRFNNTVNGNRLVLDDSSYINPIGETYTVHKLKYYIGQIRFYNKAGKAVLKKGYFLINHSDDSSCTLRLPLPEGAYGSMEFLIGVDSATNTAGAQTGALDPLNDMFWTWQSGYIMQKLEGSSPQSSVVNNKMEYHLGGYGGPNKTQRLVNIDFSEQPLVVHSGRKSNILIKAELNKFWLGASNVSIKEIPVCSSAGPLANQLSFNFASMFSLESVTNN